MRDLPTGVVTLLFTDVEGSTRLLHSLGDDYGEALQEHRRRLRSAFAKHDGVEVDTQGDAFFVAFARASDAVAAAAEGQRALAAGPVRVRMGLHTGEPRLTEEGYVGLDVHKGARIAAVGHGGQVLLSQATRALVEADVRDLGVHRLKDLGAPERIYQLEVDGIPGDFPLLKTIEAGIDNLPGLSTLPLVRHSRPVKASVLGRDELLEQLARFIDGLADGPASLVIAGEAGIGKTSVWEATLDRATQRGCRVLASRSSEAETALAYSGLADLLVGLEPGYLDDLPSPQRRALEVALFLAEPEGRAPEPRAIFSGLVGVVRTLALDAPVLIAVDDVQWLDASSVRALDFAARRVADLPFGILATLRGSTSTTMGSPFGAVVLRLEQLSATTLYQLVKERLGVSLPRTTVLRLHRASGGNPLFALELTSALLGAGLPDANSPWPVPDDLRTLVESRVARLPSPARRVLLSAAASGRSYVSELDGETARTLQEAGLVTAHADGIVRFAHPLVASAVYESATPAERRRTHARLAARAAEIEEQARHGALSAAGPDPEVAGLLDQAAARALARGSPEVAAELEEQATSLTPADQPEDICRRRIVAAEHHLRAGAFGRVHELLRDLEATAQPGATRSTVLRLQGEASLSLGSAEHALGCFRRAASAAEGDPVSSARAELDLAFALVQTFGSFAEAAQAATQAVESAERVDDPVLLSSALVTSTLADFLLGHGADLARLDRGLELEDPEVSVPIERRPSLVAGWVLLQVGQLERARDVLVSLRDRLVEQGEESELPDLLATLSRLECLAGNLSLAAEHADRGYELARQTASDGRAAQARATRALVDAHAGRIADARAAAAEAIDLAARSGHHLAAFLASAAIALAELSVGGDALVVATLERSLGLIDEHGLAEPTRAFYLPDAIEALVGVGDIDRALRLAELLEMRGRELNRDWAIVTGARGRALALAARGETKEALSVLERALAEAPDLPLLLELGRTMIVKGQLERRRKRKTAARATLVQAVELCERAGATLWADRARAELARLGRGPDPGDLTATEARVAALAASGHTNREIATAAFMSQKTVEANLSRIYRKLGIRSRAELGLELAKRQNA